MTLLATTFERLLLPSGRIVDVPKATPSFSVWRGEQPADRYGKKPVLDFEGRMAFAELAILWSLQKSGWNGVWVDTYRRKFRADYWNAPPVELPPEPKALLDRIAGVRGGRDRGTWDVFCWRAANTCLQNRNGRIMTTSSRSNSTGSRRLSPWSYLYR